MGQGVDRIGGENDILEGMEIRFTGCMETKRELNCFSRELVRISLIRLFYMCLFVCLFAFVCMYMGSN